MSGEEPEHNVRALFGFTATFDEWLARWQQRTAAENHPERQAQMLKTNPAIIPRNHLVEEAIRAASEDNDFSVFHALVDALENPFLSDPLSFDWADTRFIKPPRPDQVVRQTFCGT